MRAHVDLKRETALVLHVEVPVGLGDGGSVEEAALADVRVRTVDGHVDEAVDDHVRHMDAAGRDFLRERLREGAERSLGRSERAQALGGAEGGSGAGDEDGALASGLHRRHHRLHCGEEANRTSLEVVHQPFWIEVCDFGWWEGRGRWVVHEDGGLPKLGERLDRSLEGRAVRDVSRAKLDSFAILRRGLNVFLHCLQSLCVATNNANGQPALRESLCNGMSQAGHVRDTDDDSAA
mmetsp:Transcript_25506/g.53379  ORF Transcript_25506/g.53379 Transcript_25506/m.53379 type:complete len:236 (+) Transcript_25506:411-1118(+)